MVRMLTFPKLGTKYLGILGVQTWESFVDSCSTRLKLEASVLDYEVLSFVACFPLCDSGDFVSITVQPQC